MPTRSRLFLSVLLGAAACGGISDPTRPGSGPVASISGTLKGDSVPSDSRVAILWRQGEAGGVAVGADAPVVGGKFTLSLAAPPNEYFYAASGEHVSSYDDPSPVSAGPRPPETTASPGVLQPQNGVSGGVAGAELAIAVAGFIVYRDGNANGALDLEGASLASSDEILGGNDALMLAYLRGGTTLDYEKARDRAGILPKPGLNLMWSEGGRWLALELVELLVDSRASLASEVCEASVRLSEPATAGSAEPKGPTTPTSEPRDAGYPSPDEVVCSLDGRSFSLKDDGCKPPPPPPPGVCNGGVDGPFACAVSRPYLSPFTPVPDGWPCEVEDGPSPDAGAGPPTIPDASRPDAKPDAN